MNELYYYAIVEFSYGVRFCRVPFGYSIKSGDLVDVAGIPTEGKVLAVEMATSNNNMLNLLTKINPEKEAFKVSAIYSKREIEWKDEEND